MIIAAGLAGPVSERSRQKTLRRILPAASFLPPSRAKSAGEVNSLTSTKSRSILRLGRAQRSQQDQQGHSE